MKKIILIFVLFLTSCSNDSVEITPEKQDEITTLQIQELAKKDTCSYKVVYLDNTMYVLNKSLKVEKRINNYSGALATMFIVILILLFFLLISLAVSI